MSAIGRLRLYYFQKVTTDRLNFERLIIVFHLNSTLTSQKALKVKPRLNDQTFSSNVVLEEHVGPFIYLSQLYIEVVF